MGRHSKKLQLAGAFVLRYSLVFFFIAFGLYKFTAGEALLAASFRDADGRLGDEDAALTTGRADADHICRLRNEAACPESECPVEQQAIRIEQVRR